MKIFTGKLPTLSPEFGCANGETFDEHIYLDTPQGWQQIVPAGLPVHPDYAKAIRAKLKTLDPRKTKATKEAK